MDSSSTIEKCSDGLWLDTSRLHLFDPTERGEHHADRHSRDGSGVTPRLGRQLDDVGGLGDPRLVGVISQDVVLDLVVDGEAQLAVWALVGGRVHGSSALQLALGSSGPSPRERVDLPADQRRASAPSREE
jgi:hypothetical protein